MRDGDISAFSIGLLHKQSYLAAITLCEHSIDAVYSTCYFYFFSNKRKEKLLTCIIRHCRNSCVFLKIIMHPPGCMYVFSSVRRAPLAANVFACSSRATECRAPIFHKSSLLAWEILLEGNLFRLTDSVMADCTSN